MIRKKHHTFYTLRAISSLLLGTEILECCFKCPGHSKNIYVSICEMMFNRKMGPEGHKNVQILKFPCGIIILLPSSNSIWIHMPSTYELQTSDFIDLDWFFPRQTSWEVGWSGQILHLLAPQTLPPSRTPAMYSMYLTCGSSRGWYSPSNEWYSPGRSPGGRDRPCTSWPRPWGPSWPHWPSTSPRCGPFPDWWPRPVIIFYTVWDMKEGMHYAFCLCGTSAD